MTLKRPSKDDSNANHAKLDSLIPMAYPCSNEDKTIHNLPANIPVISINNNSVESKNNLSRRKYYLKTGARIPPATISAHHPGKLANLPSVRYRHGDPGKCDICSTRGGPGLRQHSVYHRHASAKEVQRVAACKTDVDSFFCPTCRFMVGSRHVPGKFHNMVDQTRLKIVLSSSTLHNFWLEGYEGDIDHVDWSTSPGATIQTLLHMWRSDYRNEKKPMDVLVIGGLNNILRGETVDKIMARFEEFFNAVELQGQKQHGNNRSTFAITTFFYPFCNETFID